LIVKNNLPIQFVENIEVIGFTFMSKITFPFQKVVFTRDIIRVSGEVKSNVCFFFALVECHYVITNFDLWISKGVY
jgi:hypothetical protein